VDPLTDDELTPAQEQRVRRLLAEARHDEPVPDDVAARLDDVLARLAAERAGSDHGATAPVDLAAHARRRRRLGAGLLVAAAAVVAGGVAVPSLLGGSADMASESTDSADEDSAGQDSAAGGEAEPAPATDVPTVRADAFRPDAARLASDPRFAARRNGAVEAPPPPAGWCEPRPAWTAGGAARLLPVRYADDATASGWLVLRRDAGGARVAELFLCPAGAAPERSATLPRR
jgi:hypothetical protein